ncbi:histidine kinase [Roseibacillus persicicus]|uniref:histidine kinase n=1 Tax=Roseibacillus persicicus TaxID=454148 RepID=UPI00398BB870
MEAKLEQSQDSSPIDWGEKFRPKTAAHSLILFAVIAVSVSLSCEISFILFDQGFWTIAPIWAPAGVVFLAFRLAGSRAWVPSILGYASLWLRFNPFELPYLFFVPFYYPVSSFLLDKTERWFRERFLREHIRAQGDILAEFVPQALVLIPFAAIAAFCINTTWFFAGVVPVMGQNWESFYKIWTLIFISHYLGVVTIGPVGIELIKARTLRLTDFTTSALGLGVCIWSQILMLAFFSGAFPNISSPRIAVFIPFAFFVMGALFVTRSQISFFLLFWCLLSFFLSGMAKGPFGSEAGISPAHIELAFYNLFIVITITGVNYGSSLYRQRVRQNALLLEAAEVIPWHWSRQFGLRFDELRGPNIAGGGPLDIYRLSCLKRGDSLAEMETTWNCRVSSNTLDSKDVIWESVGRVVSRNRDGEPEEIIGLIRNVAIKDQMKEALLTVEYQNEKLRGLTSQLNPHFLFNSLNMIRMLVHTDPVKAEKAVITLAQLLRMTLNDVGKKVIPFNSELKHIKALLEIASMRFEGRLKYDIKLTNLPAYFVVPSMMILNFVENALTHGIAKRVQGGEIQLSLTGDDKLDIVTMELVNSGRLETAHNQGVGLSGARQRLELLYGARATFSIEEIPNEKVLCILRIPPTP